MGAILALAPCTAMFAVGTLDAGGRGMASADYTMDGSLGGIVGISISAVSSETVKHGFIGQLVEPVGFTITGAPSEINDNASCQLGGWTTLDDDTVSALDGSDIIWHVPAWPIQSISSVGLLTPAGVYTNTPASFTGNFLGLTDAGALMVLDHDPDDFGIYAHDGIQDTWQARFFGLDNPEALPHVDHSGCGQDNLFKYIAGLDPTNVASLFVLRLARVADDRADIAFSPCLYDRAYTVEASTNLLGCEFAPLKAASTNDSGVERTVTDLSSLAPQKFFRVRISYQK